MKFAINLPLMIAWQAYGEAFALARDLGVDPKRLLSLFSDTAGANIAMKNCAPMMVAMFEDRDSGPAVFDIDSGVKDLRAMLAEGHARGIDMPLIERTLSCFEEAAKNGLGGRDSSMVPVYWARRGANV